MPNWVIRSDALKGTEKLLYIALLNRANSKGESWPSLATLTKDVGVSRGTIVSRLEKLCSLGLIRKTGRVYKHGGQATNVYTILTWDAPQGGSADSVPPSAGEERGVVQMENGGSAGEEHEVLPTEVLPIRSTTHMGKRSSEKPLPEDWAPSQAHKDYAAEHRLDLGHELFQFKAYAEANDRRQRNWNGAFTSWLGNAKKWGRTQPEKRKVKVFNDEVD